MHYELSIVHGYREKIPKTFRESERYRFFNAPVDYVNPITNKAIKSGDLPTFWGEAAANRCLQQRSRSEGINFPMHGRPAIPEFYNAKKTSSVKK